MKSKSPNGGWSGSEQLWPLEYRSSQRWWFPLSRQADVSWNRACSSASFRQNGFQKEHCLLVLYKSASCAATPPLPFQVQPIFCFTCSRWKNTTVMGMWVSGQIVSNYSFVVFAHNRGTGGLFILLEAKSFLQTLSSTGLPLRFQAIWWGKGSLCTFCLACSRDVLFACWGSLKVRSLPCLGTTRDSAEWCSFKPLSLDFTCKSCFAFFVLLTFMHRWKKPFPVHFQQEHLLEWLIQIVCLVPITIFHKRFIMRFMTLVIPGVSHLLKVKLTSSPL